MKRLKWFFWVFIPFAFYSNAQSPLLIAEQNILSTQLPDSRQPDSEFEQGVKKPLACWNGMSDVLPDYKHQTRSTFDKRAPDTNSALIQRSLEIARLEAQISKDWNAYQERPRRKFIGARTQEYRYARYIEDWRQKIERVSELNYPQAARDQRIYGSLMVTVAICADGSVERVQINRSSGNQILDEAVINIVRLAAPFEPLPLEIRQEVDVLHIIRTWTFTRVDNIEGK